MACIGQYSDHEPYQLLEAFCNLVHLIARVLDGVEGRKTTTVSGSPKVTSEADKQQSE